MDISMDIQGKSVDMDMNMDGKFHIRGKPGHSADNLCVTIGRMNILADAQLKNITETNAHQWEK